MPIDPKYFPFTRHLKAGDRVQAVFTGGGDPIEGVVKLIWLGIEECVEVDGDDGERYSFFPALGDIVQRPVPPLAVDLPEEPQ